MQMEEKNCRALTQVIDGQLLNATQILMQKTLRKKTLLNATQQETQPKERHSTNATQKTGTQEPTRYRRTTTQNSNQNGTHTS